MTKQIKICNDLIDLLNEPEIRSTKVSLYESEKIIEHIKECETCKNSLKDNIHENISEIPFPFQVLIQSLIK